MAAKLTAPQLNALRACLETPCAQINLNVRRSLGDKGLINWWRNEVTEAGRQVLTDAAPSDPQHTDAER